MAECDRCPGDDGPTYTCNYCGDNFCSDHRLPENHACPALSLPSGTRRLESEGPDTSESESTSASGSSSGTPDALDLSDRELPGSDSSDLGDPSPDVAPDGSIDRGDGERSSESSRDPQRTRRAVQAAKRAERTFVALPWLLWWAIRRYGPSVLLLSAITIVAAGVLGLSLGPLGTPPNVLGGFGGADAPPAAAVDSNTTTTTATTASRSTTETTASESRPDGGQIARGQLKQLIHERVNEVRRTRGLEPLTYNRTLRDAARFHSRDMALNDYFAHESPEGGTFQDRYFRVGFECRVETSESRYATGGENILFTFYQERVRTENGTAYYGSMPELADGVVTSWMASEGHRENLLRPYWQQEAIGVYVEETADGTKVYVTQNFC